MMAIRLQQVGDHHIMSPKNGSRREGIAATHSVSEFSNATEPSVTPANPQAIAGSLAEHAAEIRRLGKRVVGDVIEIGARLTECKASAVMAIGCRGSIAN